APYTGRLGTPADPGTPLPVPPRAPTTAIAHTSALCDLGNGAGADRAIVFDAGNWNIDQTVTVTAVDDLTVELARSCPITHTISSGDPVYANLDDPPPFSGSPASFDASIQDYDPPSITDDPPFVDIATTSGLDVAEATPAVVDTMTVVLRRQPLSPVDVTFTATAPQVLLEDADASTPEPPAGDLALHFTPADWDTPQTVRVYAVDDAVDEPTEAVTIIHGVMASLAAGFDDPSLRAFVLDGETHLDAVDIPVTVTDNETGPGEGPGGPDQTSYFAEGTVRPGFVEYLTLQNPGASDAVATLQFQAADDGGVPFSLPDDVVALPPSSR